MLTDPLDRAAELVQAGTAVCAATVIASDDPAVRPGARLLALRDGTVEGSVGDAGLDREVAELAAGALARNRREAVTVGSGIRVFLDVLAEGAQLVVCGAGHIAVPLARFARAVGFTVTVIDDRPEFAHPDRFPGCAVIADEFVDALERAPFGPVTYAVVITRGHEHDADCLEAVLPRETAYVGLIGSRRRVRFVLDTLERAGAARDRLEQVFTPIGLPIGAESPEEIALSIVAELVCVRRKGPAQARALRAAVEKTP